MISVRISNASSMRWKQRMDCASCSPNQPPFGHCHLWRGAQDGGSPRMCAATRSSASPPPGGPSPEGARELARVVREALNDLAGLLADQAGVARDQIAEACLVGNTAMTHLLLELPVSQLSASPFVAATSSALDVKAHGLHLDLAAGAYVHILPCVGGFVGADHVAMILASDLDRRDQIAIGVDIGTTTEIALWKPGLDFLNSASCSSGPAFEGAHIRDGMRAAVGGIEAVH